MKQAILITAYKNPEFLLKIISFFDAPDFLIFIHWDKKSQVDKEFKNKVVSAQNVQLFSTKYRVNWGGFNHLRAILLLLNESYSNKSISFFHLISGQDYPIKTLDDFRKQFHRNNKKSYIDYFNVPYPRWANNGGLDRLEYYNFYDLFNGKIGKQNFWINKLLRLQIKLKIKRKLPKSLKLYGGSTWWSINRSSVINCFNFLEKNKRITTRFKYTLCSEEFFFQTILLNSCDIDSLENNNFRYIDWVPRNGNNPAVLDETDFSKIVNSRAFFARKIESPISDELLKKIMAYGE